MLTIERKQTHKQKENPARKRERKINRFENIFSRGAVDLVTSSLTSELLLSPLSFKTRDDLDFKL